MINNRSHKLPKLFVAAAIAAIAATCAFGLAACQGGQASGGTAATVNGTAIPEQEVTDTIQTVRAQSGLDDTDAWGQFLASNNMTPESVREQILDSLIDQELVKQGAAELGVVFAEIKKTKRNTLRRWMQICSRYRLPVAGMVAVQKCW